MDYNYKSLENTAPGISLVIRCILQWKKQARGDIQWLALSHTGRRAGIPMIWKHTITHTVRCLVLKGGKGRHGLRWQVLSPKITSPGEGVPLPTLETVVSRQMIRSPSSGRKIKANKGQAPSTNWVDSCRSKPNVFSPFWSFPRNCYLSQCIPPPSPPLPQHIVESQLKLIWDSKWLLGWKSKV